MRIALVSERFLPHLGGIELHVEVLAKGLTARGHDVEVLCAEPALATRTTRPDGYLVRNFASVPFVQGTRLPLGMLRAVRGRYDVVHIHNYHSLVLASLSLVRSPTVLTPHFHGRGRTALLNALHGAYSKVSARWVRRAGVVICVSQYEAKRFASRFPETAGRVVVIPNALRAAFEPKPILDDARRLLCIGRLERYKRFDLGILALRSLPDWQMTVVGEGPDRARLARLARRYGVADRILFTGRVSDEDAALHLQTATCVLQLSSLEAFGMTTLEAVAAGRPVVVTRGTAPAELAEAFPGWVHPSQSLSPQHVVNAIKEASSDVPRSRPDLTPFQPERIVEATITAYERAISRSYELDG